jgi:hypothetical protein
MQKSEDRAGNFWTHQVLLLVMMIGGWGSGLKKERLGM